ncbi:MAG: biopolymer transporter ExbD [Burkholderiales bacterium]|nr:biopolymer transporter ExbD [Burkholderiales bacterium]
MAFGRLERSPSPKPMADINMTPLIDVMLVLLVIFMITAPLMTASLRLDLPKGGSAPDSAPAQPLQLAITADGSFYIGDEKIAPAQIEARLADAAKRQPDAEVQLRADRNAIYGRVAELIAQLQVLGLNRIAFITEPAPAASR